MLHYGENGLLIACDNGLVAETDDCPCGLWVAGGQSNNVAVSLGGINWVNYNCPIVDTRSIATDGNIFVAVGGGGEIKIATSIDGKIWTARESLGIDNINGIAWNGSYFIAVGGREPGQILKSSNGINWSIINLDDTLALGCVAWNGSRWVACGATFDGVTTFVNVTAISSNGTNWTIYNDDIPNILSIAWNGFLWLGSGNTSIDGISWTARVTASYGTIWNGEFWLCEGNGVILKSFDAIDWVNTGFNIKEVFNIGWNGSLFVLVGNDFIGATITSVVYTSKDGENWTFRSGGVLGRTGLSIANIPAPNLYPPIL